MENRSGFEYDGTVPGSDTQIELVNLAQSENNKSANNRWQLLFQKYDEDGSGRIPTRKFAEDLKRESFNKNVPQHVVRKILARADKDKDGYITYTEFIDMIRTPDGYQLMTGWITSYINHTIPRRDRKVQTDDVDGLYEDEYSCFPPPICMVIISLLEILTFVYDYTKTGTTDSVNGPSAAIFIYDPHKRKQVWRFLTYMFVHVGLFHLGVNLIVQIVLGIPLEMVHKWWRILLVYLAGVVAGSLLTSVVDPRVYLAGASGGVYALITAHLATLILNWSEMQFALLQLIIFIILCGSDIGTNLYNHFVLHMETQIGYAAHLGGAIAGLLVGLYVLRNLEVRPWEKKICWAALCLYIILTVVAIFIHIFASDYFPFQTA